MSIQEPTSNSNPVRVGVCGLGRSGWNIHVKTIQTFPEQFKVVAVADMDEGRQKEARDTLGCRSYSDVHDLFRDEDVELVVVSTFNRYHSEHTIAALEAGKHVLCEKPFALTVADADRAIETAKRVGRLVMPFQNRRYEPNFHKVLEVVRSGILGEITLVRIAQHGFGRRWDWQTLLEYGAGQMSNNGPHMLDQGVHFLGEGQLEIFADLRRALASGDAEDHCKVVVKAETGPTIDMELTSTSPYPQDRWTIMGTAGGLRGGTGELHWKWVDWSTMPERPVDPRPTPDRSYNREKLEWHEDSWQSEAKFEGDNRSYYRDMYAALREGKPLVVTPESARRYVAILEHCRRVYRDSLK